jgi:SAM-dependent methyltransferase
MSDVCCRTCGSTSVTHVGTLPNANAFAGRRLSAPLPGGNLWHCSSCGFAFRFPLLSEDTYADLYRNGSLNLWDVEQRRVDFDLIRNYLETYPPGYTSIVDVGCYTGQFLSSVPGKILRYGVEPNPGAAKIAASREISILAKTADEFASTTGFYDVIVACDVIEHVENPLQFLQQLSRRLTPSGQLLVTTGNYDSWLWRLTRAKYWYCHFPEHISFIGPRWVRQLPGKLGLKICKVVPFNYSGRGFSLKQMIAALLFAWNRPLYRLIRSRAAMIEETEIPPGCGAIRDHILCIFQRVSPETPQSAD